MGRHRFLAGKLGRLQVTVMGTEYSFWPAAICDRGGCCWLSAVWIVLKDFCAASLRFGISLERDETGCRLFRRNRERKGYEALSNGLMQLAVAKGVWQWPSRKGRPNIVENVLTLNKLLIAARLLNCRLTTRQGGRNLSQAADQRNAPVSVGCSAAIMKQKLAEADTETSVETGEKPCQFKPEHAEPAMYCSSSKQRRKTGPAHRPKR